MKASQDKPKKNEKGVSFGALETKETIDRHSNSIDKLTSLVNKLDMKIDRRKAQYRPIVYQNRGRGCRQRQNNNYRNRNRSYSRDSGQSFNSLFTIAEIIDPIIELGVSQELVMGIEMAIEGMIDMTVDQIIEETSIDRITEIKGIGIESQVKAAVGPGKDIEIIQGTTIGMSPTTEIKVGIDRSSSRDEGDKGPGQFQETGIEKAGPLQGLDLVHMF